MASFYKRLFKSSANAMKPSVIMSGLRKFASGRLSGSVYDRITNNVMLIMLPSVLFPPLRYITEPSNRKKEYLFRDTISSWGGLGIYFLMQNQMGKALYKVGLRHEPMRAMLAVFVAVMGRLLFQGAAVTPLTNKIFKKFGWGSFKKVPPALQPPSAVPVKHTFSQWSTATPANFQHPVQNPNPFQRPVALPVKPIIPVATPLPRMTGLRV